MHLIGPICPICSDWWRERKFFNLTESSKLWVEIWWCYIKEEIHAGPSILKKDESQNGWDLDNWAMFKRALEGFLDLPWPFKAVGVTGFQCRTIQEIKQVIDWEKAEVSIPKTSMNWHTNFKELVWGVKYRTRTYSSVQRSLRQFGTNARNLISDWK